MVSVSRLSVIRHTAFIVNGDDFLADLFVLPLAGYDIVLGNQCLATLAPSSGISAPAR